MASLFLTLAVAVIGQADPERRALAFLVREVPAWSAQNKCYSCHNNGDAARALFAAARRRYAIPPEALAATTRWLARPHQWDHNGGEGSYSDKGLARIQFAAALADALDAKLLTDRRPLARAAELLAKDQQPDGSWKVDSEGMIGSPATYGTCLATYHARRTLQQADAHRYRAAIAKADDWLRKVAVETVLDAAAVLMALEVMDSPDVAQRRKHCLDLVRKGQSAKGGWGPYINSPPEPFDTAVVMLALARYETDKEDIAAMIRRGRQYLIATQKPDGSWPETTRPAGSGSYAQRLSTTGWATQALLGTSDRKRKD